MNTTLHFADFCTTGAMLAGEAVAPYLVKYKTADIAALVALLTPIGDGVLGKRGLSAFLEEGGDDDSAAAPPPIENRDIFDMFLRAMGRPDQLLKARTWGNDWRMLAGEDTYWQPMMERDFPMLGAVLVNTDAQAAVRRLFRTSGMATVLHTQIYMVLYVMRAQHESLDDFFADAFPPPRVPTEEPLEVRVKRALLPFARKRFPQK